MKPLPDNNLRMYRTLRFVIWIILAILLASCRHHPRSVIYKVEKNIAFFPDSLPYYISAISTNEIDNAEHNSLYSPHRIVALCCYKAGNALQTDNKDSVRFWLDKASDIAYRHSFLSPSASWLQRADTVQIQSCIIKINSAREQIAKATAYSEIYRSTGDSTLAYAADSIRQHVSAGLLSMYEIPATQSSHTFNLSIPYRYTYMAILALLLLLLLLWQHKEKRKAKDKCRDVEQREIIAHLNETIKQTESENESLQKRIQETQQVKASHIGCGLKIYETVRAGGVLKNISVEDERCFVDYFAFAFPAVYQQIVAPYSSLSLRHTTYLVLCQMGFSDTDIGRILFVQPSTLRNYRLRIKQKRRMSK